MKITRRKVRVEVSNVAMGDIAFNLLIFFVILAKAQDDSHLKWQPAVTPRVESAGHSRVSVTIDRENKVHLNGRQVGVAQLAPAIERELGAAPSGKRTVLLKVHREATAQLFEPVIEAVSQAGGDLVHVLEEQKE